MVIDCPDPHALAAFYSALVGLPITYTSDDWVVIAVNDATSGYAFQRAPDHRPPRWPDPDAPQQFHLDIMVEDVRAAEPAVIELGARKLAGDVEVVGDGGRVRLVFADPAGHPFCLIRRPPWAPPIPG